MLAGPAVGPALWAVALYGAGPSQLSHGCWETWVGAMCVSSCLPTTTRPSRGQGQAAGCNKPLQPTGEPGGVCSQARAHLHMWICRRVIIPCCVAMPGSGNRHAGATGVWGLGCVRVFVLCGCVACVCCQSGFAYLLNLTNVCLPDNRHVVGQGRWLICGPCPCTTVCISSLWHGHRCRDLSSVAQGL